MRLGALWRGAKYDLLGVLRPRRQSQVCPVPTRFEQFGAKLGASTAGCPDRGRPTRLHRRRTSRGDDAAVVSFSIAHDPSDAPHHMRGVFLPIML